MRLLIAMMKHETNTFSPVPTPLQRFGHGPGPLYGEADEEIPGELGVDTIPWVQLVEMTPRQFADHASYSASRSRALHHDGPVALHYLRAQIYHKRALFRLGKYLIWER